MGDHREKKFFFALVEEVAQVKVGDGLAMGGRSGDRPTAIAAAAEERDGIVNKFTRIDGVLIIDELDDDLFSRSQHGFVVPCWVESRVFDDDARNLDEVSHLRHPGEYVHRDLIPQPNLDADRACHLANNEFKQIVSGQNAMRD